MTDTFQLKVYKHVRLLISSSPFLALGRAHCKFSNGFMDLILAPREDSSMQSVALERALKHPVGQYVYLP